jgi:peroxiredoxin Q/BCP
VDKNLVMKTLKLLLITLTLLTTTVYAATEVKLNEPARTFKLQTEEGKEFDLASRKGTWTVLYFYPKAETPGCTTQACAFRDNIKKIRVLNADVFGISTNTVAEQAGFHKNHNLNFTLLADDKADVTKLYDAKMAVVNYAKRWTFIIDPNLIVRDIQKDVDPILDSARVAKKLEELQAKK